MSSSNDFAGGDSAKRRNCMSGLVAGVNEGAASAVVVAVLVLVLLVLLEDMIE